MATAHIFKIDAAEKFIFSVPGLTQDSADKTSELLQKNHGSHHIFFDRVGRHNHNVHMLLTLYALGATPTQLESHYHDHEGYQRPFGSADASIVAELETPAGFTKYLGHQNDKNWPEWLAFWERKVAALGWQETLQTHVFAGDERADDLLIRMFAGLFHPLLHLGFAVESQQPALIVEALSMACLTNAKDTGNVLLPMEAAARSRNTATLPPVPVATLLRDLRANEKLTTAARWSDGEKLKDGIMGRAGADMIALAARYAVVPADLPARVHEMTQLVALFTAAAQNPPHVPRLDFFVMHTLTPAIFFRAFCIPDRGSAWDFLDDKVRCRLLEWTVRRALAEYAARGAPALHLDDLEAYTPAATRNGPATDDGAAWAALLARAVAYPDDGHAQKVIRALAWGDSSTATAATNKFETLFPRELWLRAAHMAIDSVDGSVTGTPEMSTLNKWVRGSGFDEAWKDVPLRADVERFTGRMGTAKV